VSRELAAALRSASAQTPPGMNRVLEQQLREARGRDGELDLEVLLKLVSAHYDRLDAECAGAVRSAQLMADAVQAGTLDQPQLADHSPPDSETRAQVALQSLGNAVITTDSEGRIDYMNPLAERLTGWESREAKHKVIGEVLSLLDEAMRPESESPVMSCLRERQAEGFAHPTVVISKRTAPAVSSRALNSAIRCSKNPSSLSELPDKLMACRLSAFSRTLATESVSLFSNSRRLMRPVSGS